MTVELHTLQTALNIAASNLYCKITLVWLDSECSMKIWPQNQTGQTSNDRY